MRCNRKKLAELLGRDVRTIDTMVGKGMPYVSRPGEGGHRSWVFDSAAVVKWLLHEDIDDRLRAVQVRLKTANAAMLELELAEQTGEMVRIADVIERFEITLMDLKSQLLNLPYDLAPLVAGESDPQIVRKIVDDAFKNVMKTLDSVPYAED